jgi:hypothetical protein
MKGPTLEDESPQHRLAGSVNLINRLEQNEIVEIDERFPKFHTHPLH